MGFSNGNGDSLKSKSHPSMALHLDNYLRNLLVTLYLGNPGNVVRSCDFHHGQILRCCL